MRKLLPLILGILLFTSCSSNISSGESFVDIKSLSYDEKENLIKIVYDTFNNSKLNYDSYYNSNSKVTVTLREKGKKLSTVTLDRGDNLLSSISIASMNAFDRTTITNTDSINVELSIHLNESLGIDNYERGITSLVMQYGEAKTYFLSKEVIEGNYRLERVQEIMCERLSLNSDCTNQVNISTFETIDFGNTYFSGDEIITFYRGNNVENIRPYVTLESVNESYELAKSFLINSLNEEGYFNYLYYPSNGNYPQSNNMIRQFMASRILSELALENDSLLELNKKNIDYIIDNWYYENGNEAYILYENRSKLGANALFLRVLVYSKYFDDYSDVALKLYNGIKTIQYDNGSFESFYVEPDYEYDNDYLLTFYSGEAILALAEYYSKTGNVEVLDTAIKSQDYYIIEYVDKLEENYYPAYVPWHTMSLYKLYQITGNEEYVNAIYILNKKLIELQNTPQSSKYTDYIGRFSGPETLQYGVPHVASDGVYTEGLIYAWSLANEREDLENEQMFRNSINIALENILRLQFNGVNMYYLQHPERVVGAFRENVAENPIRVDSTQHVVDAYTVLLRENSHFFTLQ